MKPPTTLRVRICGAPGWNFQGPKSRRRRARSQAGELIRYDASPHHWWPGSALVPLALAADDATGFIPLHGFLSGETTRGHFGRVRTMIEVHGLPEALCTDGLGTFGARSMRGQHDDVLNQFRWSLLSDKLLSNPPVSLPLLLHSPPP